MSQEKPVGSGGQGRGSSRGPLSFGELKPCLLAVLRRLAGTPALAEALQQRLRPAPGRPARPLPILLAAGDGGLLARLKSFTSAHQHLPCPRCEHHLAAIDYNQQNGLQCHWCNAIVFPLALLRGLLEGRVPEEKRRPEAIIRGALGLPPAAGEEEPAPEPTTRPAPPPAPPAPPGEKDTAEPAARPAAPAREGPAFAGQDSLPEDLNDLSVLDLMQTDRRERVQNLFGQVEDILGEAGSLETSIDSAAGAPILRRMRVLRQSLLACEQIEARIEDRWRRRLASFRQRLDDLREVRERFSGVMTRLKELGRHNAELLQELERAWERERHLGQELAELRRKLEERGEDDPAP